MTNFFLIFLAISIASAQNNSFDQMRLDFALDLYKNVTSGSTSNEVMSPLSVDIALSMLLLGSSGVTFRELMASLEYPYSYSQNVIIANYYLLTNRLNSIDGLSVATKLYFNQNDKIDDKYQSNIRKSFSSEIESIDFTDNIEVATKMNKWVDQATKYLVPEVIQPDAIDQNICMIGVNCIYFNGTWLYPFDKSLTIEDDFFISDKMTKKVSYMRMKRKLNFASYIREIGSSVLELPYTVANTSMIFVLPITSTLDDVVKNILYVDWGNIESQMQNVEVSVIIPKFNLTVERFMKNDLQNMGMNSMFDKETSSINRIIATKKGKSKNLYIDEIFHKADIGVDSEMTNTATVKENSSSTKFIASSPFLYFIRSGSTILFMGQFTGAE